MNGRRAQGGGETKAALQPPVHRLIEKRMTHCRRGGTELKGDEPEGRERAT